MNVGSVAAGACDFRKAVCAIQSKHESQCHTAQSFGTRIGALDGAIYRARGTAGVAETAGTGSA